jgi:hypothetical protein
VAAELRGVMQIKTMASLVDARRIRTSAGALLELSMLEMEKERLKKEMLRAEQRLNEIRSRTGEIEAKQQRLNLFVDRSAVTNPASAAAQAGQPVMGPAAAAPFPIHHAPTDGFKRRQLSY